MASVTAFQAWFVDSFHVVAGCAIETQSGQKYFMPTCASDKLMILPEDYATVDSDASYEPHFVGYRSNLLYNKEMDRRIFTDREKANQFLTTQIETRHLCKVVSNAKIEN